MEKRVLTVLRSGGEYTAEHVQAIQRQVVKHGQPGTRFMCLSDVDVPGVECIPLVEDWPGWWSKIALFGPHVPDDFLYTDLDNVIYGSICELQDTDQFIADIGFSFFRVTPETHRASAYAEFRDEPAYHMHEWDPDTRRDGKFGDAAFLRWRCGLAPAEWGPAVRNIVDIQLYPWHEHRSPGKGVKVVLCGGKRRRPWLHVSQALQRAYWCRP